MFPAWWVGTVSLVDLEVWSDIFELYVSVRYIHGKCIFSPLSVRDMLFVQHRRLSGAARVETNKVLGSPCWLSFLRLLDSQETTIRRACPIRSQRHIWEVQLEIIPGPCRDYCASEYLLSLIHHY